MKMHELKTINPYFTDTWDGKKPFEIRKDDRGFAADDILWLREYEPSWEIKYSGRDILCRVDYILPAGKFEGLHPEYCCMGLIILQRRGDE